MDRLGIFIIIILIFCFIGIVSTCHLYENLKRRTKLLSIYQQAFDIMFGEEIFNFVINEKSSDPSNDKYVICSYLDGKKKTFEVKEVKENVD